MARTISSGFLCAMLFMVPCALASELLGYDMTYKDFLLQFRGHSRTDWDPTEYSMRQALFEERKAEVVSWNARTDRSWTAGLNSFSDYTHEERMALAGVPHAQVTPSAFLMENPNQAVSMTAMRQWSGPSNKPPPVPPENFTRLTSASWLRSQGGCGSCWAMSTVGIIEVQRELAGLGAVKLAPQELIDKVQNRRGCGGPGGCGGATSPIAFNYALDGGICAEDMYVEKTCKGKSVGQIASFSKLPVGKWAPFFKMVQQEKPLVVNVDAVPWFSYMGGVLTCPENAFTPGHKVLLVGWGTENKGKENEKNYFWIRNSWGSTWGEKGYIRMGYSSDEEENCGTPTDPTLGSYCPRKDAEQADRKPLRLCGACGLLSEVLYVDV